MDMQHLRIGLRADVSQRTGLGHLKRCLSLARALQALGAEVRLLSIPTDVPLAPVLAGTGVVVDAVADDHPQTVAQAWRDWAPHWVIIDHYQRDADWHDAVRSALGTRLAVIDDLADRPLSADVLIDHNFVPGSGHRAQYAAMLQRAPSRWCCGPQYALLDPVYQDATPIDVAPTVRSVGIFMGGTDPAGLSVPVAKACREAGFTGPIEVACTSSHPDLEGLQHWARCDPSLTLSLNQPNLRDFFARHDLQIGAGGGATWERCRLGVPTLTLCVADNQRAVIPALADLGAIATTPDNRTDTLTDAIRGLLDDAVLRQQLACAARQLVDGRGANRVALTLASLAPPGLQIRHATLDDARLMWLWRNHPQTRAVSRDSQAIEWEQHLAWVRGSLSRADRHLMMAHVGPQTVGVIRFDAMAAAGPYEVSLYLDPQLHGIGLGGQLLLQGEQALLHGLQAPTLDLHAEVLPGNSASHRLFQAAGYTAAGATTYSKSLSRMP